MQRTKKVTKRQRKQMQQQGQSEHQHEDHNHQHQHIHCVACGRHIDPEEFEQVLSPSATIVRCLHNSAFASCMECVEVTKEILAEHDRTGEAVRAAAAWHLKEEKWHYQRTHVCWLLAQEVVWGGHFALL
jgi:G3E family GTPase